MGYRSQVVLIVGKEVMPQFLVTLAKSPETREMCFGEADKMIKDYDGDGNILFAWDSIKWYDSYEPIRAIDDFMDWCDAEEIPVDGEDCEAGYFFRFVRTGEDDDDNVCRGYGFEHVYVERRITF